MLDLESGIHFHKIEMFGTPILSAGDEKLDSSGADVINRARRRNCRLPECLAQPSRQVWRWRLLKNFLVAALDRTVPLGQPKRPTVLIAKDLHLDMAGTGEIALEQYPIIAKTG